MFQEKKRVKELQKRIQNIGEERNSLKNEITQFRLNKIDLKDSHLETQLEQLQQQSNITQKKHQQLKLELEKEKQQKNTLKKNLIDLREKLKQVALHIKQKESSPDNQKEPTILTQTIAQEKLVNQQLQEEMIFSKKRQRP